MDALKIIAAAVSTASLLSLATYIYLAYRGASATLYSTVHVRLMSWRSKVFLTVAAIAFLICMFSGASTLLYWMPPEWGSIDSDGEFQTIRSSLATAFAFFGGGALIIFIDKATHEKFFLRKEHERVEAFRKIFDTILAGGALGALRQDYIERIRALEAGVTVSTGYLTSDGQRILMYHDLLSLVEKLQSQKDSAMSPRETIEPGMDMQLIAFRAYLENRIAGKHETRNATGASDRVRDLLKTEARELEVILGEFDERFGTRE